MKIASIIIAALALSLMGIGLVKISHLRFKNQRTQVLAAPASFIDLSKLGINISGAKSAAEAAKLILAAEKQVVSKAEQTQYNTVATDVPSKQGRKAIDFNSQFIDNVVPPTISVLQYELSAQQAEELKKEIKACPKGFAVLKVNPTSSIKFTKDSFEFGYQLIVVNCKNAAAVQYLALTGVRAGKITPMIEKKMVEECTKDRFGFKKCVNVEKQIETPRPVDEALKALITKVVNNRVIETCEQLNKF